MENHLLYHNLIADSLIPLDKSISYKRIDQKIHQIVHKAYQQFLTLHHVNGQSDIITVIDKTLAILFSYPSQQNKKTLSNSDLAHSAILSLLGDWNVCSYRQCRHYIIIPTHTLVAGVKQNLTHNPIYRDNEFIKSLGKNLNLKIASVLPDFTQRHIAYVKLIINKKRHSVMVSSVSGATAFRLLDFINALAQTESRAYLQKLAKFKEQGGSKMWY